MHPCTAAGGICLQPLRFAPTLLTWEEHWLQAGQEAALDHLIAELTAWLRHCGGDPDGPPPSDAL
jgi:hypothetical protein